MPNQVALQEQEVEKFHRDLRGLPAPETWGKLQACETPRQHKLVQHTMKLPKRKYHLVLMVCEKCPLALVRPATGKEE